MISACVPLLIYYANCESNQSEMSTNFLSYFSHFFFCDCVSTQKRLHDKTVQWMNHEWNQSFSFFLFTLLTVPCVSHRGKVVEDSIYIMYVGVGFIVIQR